MVHYSTLQYIMVHYGTLCYIMVLYGTLLYSTVHYGTLWYIIVHYSTYKLGHILHHLGQPGQPGQPYSLALLKSSRVWPYWVLSEFSPSQLQWSWPYSSPAEFGPSQILQSFALLKSSAQFNFCEVQPYSSLSSVRPTRPSPGRSLPDDNWHFNLVTICPGPTVQYIIGYKGLSVNKSVYYWLQKPVWQNFR